MRYVALLRAINLAKQRRMAMADLRHILESLGYEDVATYLQSGNAVFTSPNEDVEELEEEIRQEIDRVLGMDVPVLIRTPKELATVVAGNPFPEATASPKYLYVSFLSAHPDPQRRAALDDARFAPDRLELGDRALYLWYADGLHTSKLSNAFLERHFGLISTSRNWNTVLKLHELAD